MVIFSSLLDSICESIQSASFLNSYRTKPTYFTRKRVLSFQSIIVFILCLAKDSIGSTLSMPHVELPFRGKTCTKQAFSKHRSHIKSDAFLKLFHDTVRHLESCAAFQKETWHGLRVFAVDGSKVNLPTHPELVSAYGVQNSTGNLPQALISVIYDVFGKHIIDLLVARHDGNERLLAKTHIIALKKYIRQPSVILFDRGYPSAELIEYLSKSGFYYLLRCPSTFLGSLSSSSSNAWVTHQFGKTSRPLSFRIVSFTLPNGPTETFCTNLSDEFTPDMIADLYRDRWAVETNYSFLKNRIQIENLSGVTLNSFLQELYAAMVITNLCAAHYADLRYLEAPASDLQGHTRERRINFSSLLSITKSSVSKMALGLTRFRQFIEEELHVENLRNLIHYLSSDSSKPRIRAHPGVKYPQSQRGSY